MFWSQKRIQQTFHNLVSIGLVEEEGSTLLKRWPEIGDTGSSSRIFRNMNAAATCSQQDPLFHEINSTNTVIAYLYIYIYTNNRFRKKKKRPASSRIFKMFRFNVWSLASKNSPHDFFVFKASDRRLVASEPPALEALKPLIDLVEPPFWDKLWASHISSGWHDFNHHWRVTL